MDFGVGLRRRADPWVRPYRMTVRVGADTWVRPPNSLPAQCLMHKR